MSDPNPAPWYRGGLRFECTQCGACCSGEPGFVWVDDDEIERMAETLDMSVDRFESEFIRRVGVKKSLKEYADGDCILLEPDQRTCLVYQARPTQCRTWPFWDSTLKTKQAWKETCQECPGAGSGPLYSLDEIEVRRRAKRV